MAASLAKSPHVALDTNFIIDLADGDEVCRDCMGVLQESKSTPRLIITPTVLQELAWLAGKASSKEVRRLATTGLRSLVTWQIIPVNLVPVAHGIAERISDEIRSKRLLPFEEKNDSLVVAEAALCDCDILVSSDQQVTGISRDELHALLARFDVKRIEIWWPQAIVSRLGKNN